MSLLRFLVPQAFVIVLTLLASASLGLEEEARLVLPALVAATIFQWNCRRRAVPEWMAFASGLVIDASTQGPLGYFALLNLLAYGLAALLAPAARSTQNSGPVSDALAFVAAVVSLAFAAWGLASLYDIARAEPWPMVVAATAAICAYPLIAAAVSLLDRSTERGDEGSVVPGG